MSNSADVVANTAATAAQMNALRADVLDPSTGHVHDGSADGGKYIGNVPVGGIIMWSGAIASIGSGALANWRLCDGTNGTPDLRGRFVIGAGGSYSVAQTGGASTVSIAHTHGINIASYEESSHTHPLYALSWFSAASGSSIYTFNNQDPTTAAGTAHSHAVVGTSGPASTTQVDIMNPYLALGFIMRIA
jgi:hypothetical protein